jgi:hypothetical protein
MAAAPTDNRVLISDWYRNLDATGRRNALPIGFVEMDWPIAVYCYDDLYYARPLSGYASTLSIVGTPQPVVAFQTCFAEIELLTTERTLVESDPFTGLPYVVRRFRADTVAVGVFPGATFNMLSDGRVFNGAEEVTDTY